MGLLDFPFIGHRAADPGAGRMGDVYFNTVDNRYKVCSAPGSWGALGGNLPTFNLPTFNLADYGAATDGTTDDTTALSDTLDAAVAAGGGIVQFPRGTTLIDAGGINMDFTNKEGILIFTGVGGGSKIKVSNDSTNKIQVGGLKKFIFRDLVVIGDSNASHDVMDDYFIKATSTDWVHVENSIFGGLHCQASGAALAGVFNVDGGHITVENCAFGGCSTYGSGNIVGYNWASMYLRNVHFPDYITIDGVYYSIGNLPSAWVLGFAASHGAVTALCVLENCTLDEGAQHGVYIYSGGALKIVDSFIHNGIGNAVRFESTGRRIDVINTKIKTTGAPVEHIAGIYADGVGVVNVEGLVFGNNCNHIQTEGAAGVVRIRTSTLNEGATYPTGLRNNAGSRVDYDNKNYTNVANTAYTALASDDLIVYGTLSGSGKTVTLPSAVGLKGKQLTIKDGAGTANANNLTLTPAGGERIDGAGNKVISTNYGSMRIVSNGADWLTI